MVSITRSLYKLHSQLELNFNKLYTLSTSAFYLDLPLINNCELFLIILLIN